MIDVAADKLQGELLDLQHGSAFIKNAKIQASTGMFLLRHYNILTVCRCSMFTLIYLWTLINCVEHVFFLTF